MEFHDDAARVEIGNGKRHFGVLHPEACGARLGHYEKHSGVLAEAFAEHQSGRAFPVLVGDFGGDFFSADAEFDGWQGVLRAALAKARQGKGQKHEPPHKQAIFQIKFIAGVDRRVDFLAHNVASAIMYLTPRRHAIFLTRFFRGGSRVSQAVS